MTQYTKLLENELQELASRYGLKLIGHQPIEQGAANSNYLLDTKQGKYILTIFEIEPVRVAHMCKVLELLAEYEFPAPRIQKQVNENLTTMYQGKPVLVKPYITGQVIKDPDANLLSQAGTAMARLHEIPIPDFLPDKHTYLTITYPKVIKDGKDQKYTNWLSHRISALRKKIPSGLPIGLIHGDLFYDNVLFEEENFKAILDFEDAHQSHKVFDLGMTVVGLCTEGTTVVLSRVRTLMDGYQKVRLLDMSERDSLQLFIEYAAILTSSWRFWKYTLDTPDIKKSRKHLQMVRIAKNVRAMPKSRFVNTVFA
ncbi:MAG: homoserine kinase [Chloroflexi bacterium]|nr:homoserine kinase [Chloroflexota bacterium]